MIYLLNWCWSKDQGAYPQPGAVDGWLGFWLRIKCSICIILSLKGRDPYNFDIVPVAIGPMSTFQTFDGPGASWSELCVGYGCLHWRYYEIRNGI